MNQTTKEPLLPQLALFQMIAGHYLSRAIYVAAKLGIADLLSKGPQHYEELAKATETHAPSLNRLLRLLAAAGVFAEKENGRFELTPIGEWLRSDIPASRRASALLFAGPMVDKAWGDLHYSIQTGGIAFDHAFGMNAFQYIGQHPEEAAVFNQAMTSSTTQAAAAVTAAYDFSAFGTIADIGGGHGVLLATILKAYPALRGILFELPHAIEGGQKQMETAGLTARCQVVGGDFFQSVPNGSDAYILKSVIHDWDDDRSIAILKNCHRAMPPGGKLLLVEIALATRIVPSAANLIATGSDVNMLVAAGGRERTEAEFRALLEAAGFKLTRIIPTESLVSVIEGVKP
jgi:SAM-dependent methyltransferase